MSLKLIITKGPAQGTTIPLDGDAPVTVGRARSNEVVLKDARVSTRHARIEVAPGGVVVTDLGSKNGTFVNGSQVSEPRMLRPGARIEVGESVIMVASPDADGSATSSTSQANVSFRADTRPRIRAKFSAVHEPRSSIAVPERVKTKAQRNLAVLHEVGALITSVRDEPTLLEKLMNVVFTTLPADRGAILLFDENTEPTVMVARTRDGVEQPDIHVSRTILRRVIDDGMSILTADAGTDARLNQNVSIIANNVRSAMCVPIQGNEFVRGAIYVDTVLSVGVFGRDDLHVLTTAGLLAGTALENIELIERNVAQARMAAVGQVVAGLGHDIRNVLTALKGGVYLLDAQLSEHDDEHLRKAWNVVRDAQDSIGGLVEDMVNFSKSREPDWARGDVNRAVLSAVAYARESANDKGVRIVELVDPTIGDFFFDSQSIERCLMNLLSNAIDAAPEGVGSVSVATEFHAEENVVRIVVRDDGDGIPAKQHERVFDVLYSTKGSRGTGFGLAITRKLAEEHGGRVLLESEPGQGATFVLEVPYRTKLPQPITA